MIGKCSPWTYLLPKDPQSCPNAPLWVNIFPILPLMLLRYTHPVLTSSQTPPSLLRYGRPLLTSSQRPLMLLKYTGPLLTFCQSPLSLCNISTSCWGQSRIHSYIHASPNQEMDLEFGLECCSSQKLPQLHSISDRGRGSLPSNYTFLR